MPTGTVKWFNNAKGFGFILPEGEGEDLFAHYSSIEMDGYRTLKAGQPVSFEVEQGEKGLHAKHIKVIKEDNSFTAPTPPTAPSSQERAEQKESLVVET